MIAALARPPLLRLARAPRAWLVPGAWAATALAYAWFARSAEGAATDRVLLDVFAPLVLPLVALGVFQASTGPAGLRASSRALQAFGASGEHATMATIAVAAATAAGLVGLLGAAVTLVAHGAGDPPFARDLFTTAWVGALGAAAYVPYFAAGATFGARGGGRGLMLVLSWLLAEAGAAGAIFSPHAHVRSLLGGPAAASFSQRMSVLDLAGLGVGCAVFAAWRCRRRG